MGTFPPASSVANPVRLAIAAGSIAGTPDHDIAVHIRERLPSGVVTIAATGTTGECALGWHEGLHTISGAHLPEGSSQLLITECTLRLTLAHSLEVTILESVSRNLAQELTPITRHLSGIGIGELRELSREPCASNDFGYSGDSPRLLQF
jgi:hypothetical protein